MAKIDITKTELVWPGKYNDDGTLKETPHVNLPFQVIETVNESRAAREAIKDGSQQSLFNTYEGNEGDTFEEGLEEQAHLGRQPAGHGGHGVAAGEVRWEDRPDLYRSAVCDGQ